MSVDEFRSKWGLVFGSMVLCELIARIDSNINAPLVAAGNELADDLRKLLAVEKAAIPVDVTVGFPRRFAERPDGGER